MNFVDKDGTTKVYIPVHPCPPSLTLIKIAFLYGSCCLRSSRRPRIHRTAAFCRQILLGGVPPTNVMCPSSEILTGITVRLILPLYIRLISDSLFDLRASDLSVLHVNI